MHLGNIHRTTPQQSTARRAHPAGKASRRPLSRCRCPSSTYPHRDRSTAPLTTHARRAKRAGLRPRVLTRAPPSRHAGTRPSRALGTRPLRPQHTAAHATRGECRGTPHVRPPPLLSSPPTWFRRRHLVITGRAHTHSSHGASAPRDGCKGGRTRRVHGGGRRSAALGDDRAHPHPYATLRAEGRRQGRRQSHARAARDGGAPTTPSRATHVRLRTPRGRRTTRRRRRLRAADSSGLCSQSS
jgi:hypothetical protein